MYDPTLLQEEIEIRTSFSFHGGKATGLEQASAMILDKAEKRFRNGSDTQAKLLRDIAFELSEMAEKERATQRQLTQTPNA